MRIVKVGLLLEAARYIRDARQASRVNEDLADSIDETAKAGDRAAEATDKLGEELSSVAQDARRLDSQIDKTKAGIRELARQIAATSDEAARADLNKKLKVEQRDLRRDLNLRKLMEAEGEDAARGFAARFGASIGPLMASAPIGPGAAAAGATLGAAMAPTLGAAIAGAVAGGVGGLGVIGGVALAARDQRVKAAGAELGQFVLGDLERRAAHFTPVVLDSIGDIRSAWQTLGPDLDRIFKADRFVDPLVRGAIAGTKRVVAGIADVMDNADPAVDSLGFAFERLGDTAGDTLTMLSQDADEGASAIDDLTMSISNLVRTAGGIVHLAAQVKGYSDQVDIAIDKGRYWFEDWMSSGGVLEGFGWQLDLTADGFAAGTAAAEAYRDATTGVADAADFATLKMAGMTDAEIAAADVSGTYRAQVDQARDATERAGEGWRTTSQSIEEFTARLDAMNASLNQTFTGNISVEQSQIALEEAIDRATAAAKENGKGIDDNIPKQRANREALVGIANAANKAAEDIYANTKSHDLAAEATERGRQGFLAAARAMNVEKGEAQRLANQLFGIPKEVSTRADFHPDTKGVRAWKSALSSIPEEIFTSARLRAIVNIETRREQATQATGRRWGGVTEHAQWGVLREAHIASPVATARYAYAEQATGGEAFIPKRGDIERSREIWSYVGANWLGMSPVGSTPRTAAAASGGVAVIHKNYHLSVNVPPTANPAEVGRATVEVIRAYEQRSGTGWRATP